MAKPSSLKNLGQVMDEWLTEIDIHTVADLQKQDVVETYLRLKEAFPEKVTLNALYALEGALVNMDWRNIPEERKVELRAMVA